MAGGKKKKGKVKNRPHQHQANAGKKPKDKERKDSNVNIGNDTRDDLVKDEEGEPDKFNDALIYDEINIIERSSINNNASKGKTTTADSGSSFSTIKPCEKFGQDIVSPPSKSSGYGDSSVNDNFDVSYPRNISNNNTLEDRGYGKKVLVDQENVVLRNETKTIEDYISLGVPRYIAEMKHPLENSWTFWYYMNDKTKGWEANNVQLAEVDTIEGFWQVYNYIEPASKIGLGCDYALFKKGIWPDWSDFQNKYGGRWIIELASDSDLDIDQLWLETLFILIGEHGEPHNETVNGAVINVRRNKFRIGVWLKDSRNYKEGVIHIGTLLKRRLDLKNHIFFSVHAEDATTGTKKGSRHSPGHFGRISV